MKTLTPVVDAAIRSPAMNVALLVEITTTYRTDYLWNGLGSLVYGAKTYLGLGRLGRIQGAGGTAEIRTTETSYELSGIVDLTELNAFLSVPVRGGTALAYVAVLDDNGRIVDFPILFDQTILDTASMLWAEDGTATLVLRGTSAVFDFRKPRGRYLSNEQLQADYPGDTGFDRLAALASRNVTWTQT